MCYIITGYVQKKRKWLKLKKRAPSPKFDNDGLIPVITMCSKTKISLMHGYMNVEAEKNY